MEIADGLATTIGKVDLRKVGPKLAKQNVASNKGDTITLILGVAVEPLASPPLDVL